MRRELTLKPAFYVLGLLLNILGVAMVIPGIVDAYFGDVDWVGFFIGAAFTIFTGLLLVFTNREDRILLSRRQAFVLTVASWIGVTAFAAVPFVFSRLNLSYTDAFFEAISGLTTTGSTVITGLDIAPPGLLLWRSILQWLGGVGIVMMAIVLLPFLRVGGMQLFRMESSDNQEKVVAKVNQLGLAVFSIYGSLTIVCAVAYAIAGMPLFDAVNHAMTTVATGGYSTSDASMGHFDSAAILWIGSIFMISGGLPFVLYIRAIRSGPGAVFTNIQVRSFLIFIGMVSAAVALWLWIADIMDGWSALTHATFNVVSIVTTTGFASTDYSVWGGLAIAAFFALTFVGGCTGSTTGGIKIFRFQVAWRVFMAHIHRLVSPNVVEVRRYADRPITEEVTGAVLLFFFVYIATVGTVTLVLAALGLDWMTAVSGAATSVSNVGPGLGAIIGPAGSFQTLPDGAKWILAGGMLLGRLEFFTVLVLLSPRFWKG